MFDFGLGGFELLGVSLGGELEMSVRAPPLGPISGRSWGLLGPSSRPLGPSWRPLGPSWGPLASLWGSLGGLLGYLGAILGTSRAVLERREAENAITPKIFNKLLGKAMIFAYWEASWGGLLGRLGASGSRKGENTKIFQTLKEIQ